MFVFSYAGMHSLLEKLLSLGNHSPPLAFICGPRGMEALLTLATALYWSMRLFQPRYIMLGLGMIQSGTTLNPVRLLPMTFDSI